MIIFGFRVSAAVLTTLVYDCDRCGQRAAHRLVKRVRRVTLFFVPLFAVGTRYLDTCTACGRVLEVTAEQAERAAAQAPPAG